MTATTLTEKKIVLRLIKDFKIDYNPSSIAKVIKISRVGAFKALNKLEAEGIVKGKNMGKARFYKINLNDEYALRNVETLLLEEARQYKKWNEEFKELYQFIDILIIFGSIIKNEEKAKDIDILIIFNKLNNNKINDFIKNKNEILTRNIHPIKQTITDLNENIRNSDRVILNALSEGVVLHGTSKLVELIKDVSSKK